MDGYANGGDDLTGAAASSTGTPEQAPVLADLIAERGPVTISTAAAKPISERVVSLLDSPVQPTDVPIALTAS